ACWELRHRFARQCVSASSAVTGCASPRSTASRNWCSCGPRRCSCTTKATSRCHSSTRCDCPRACPKRDSSRRTGSVITGCCAITVSCGLSSISFTVMSTSYRPSSRFCHARPRSTEGAKSMDDAWTSDHGGLIGNPHGPAAWLDGYPGHLTRIWTLRSGQSFTMRPVRHDDGALEEAFIHSLSRESAYQRMLSGGTKVTPELIAYMTQ